MTTIWEIDYYSRPIVDEKGKKLWEVLVCQSPLDIRQSTASLFQYAQYCPSTEVNSVWLRKALEEAMAKSGQTPQKIRFFRRQMNNMITKACNDMGIPALPSRRTFALQQWLNVRMQEVYPVHPNYQPRNSPSVQLETPLPQPLPDALVGQRWAFVTLEVSTLAEMSEWQIDFGEAFPLEMMELQPNTQIPGVVIFSSRALPMAGWMSGIEPAFIKFQSQPQPRLILETGGSESWILARGLNATIQKEATGFEETKQQAKGVHFLAIQSSPEVESFAGFWLLQELPTI